jgi:hypothetical protein
MADVVASSDLTEPSSGSPEARKQLRAKLEQRRAERSLAPVTRRAVADSSIAPERPTVAAPRSAASPAWQKWDAGLRGHDAVPSISVTRSLQLHVSSRADLLLGTPAHVDLLYCADPPMIGIRPAGSDGIKVRRSQGQNGFHLAARSFITYHGIDSAVTRRWRAEILDGVLCVHIDREPLATTSRTHTRRGGPV